MVKLRLPVGIDDLPRHRQHLVAACEIGQREPDVIGMAIAGSFVEGSPDKYSDLDLRLVIANGALDEVFARREELARACGSLIAAFTGEHVGEPQLLITLYNDLVHVDYLFTELSDAATRNDGRRVRILWERTSDVTAALASPYIADPAADVAWLEARIWTWCWYIQSKILRGELWEAVAGLGTIRNAVLFRLLAMTQGVRHRGARFAEELVGEHSIAIDRTYPIRDREALLDALRSSVQLYLVLADPLLERHMVQPAVEARRVVLHALDAGLDGRLC